MARFKGVRAKGDSIEIAFQVRGRRHWHIVHKTPTDAALADAARLRKKLIEDARLGGPSVTKTLAECCVGFLSEKAKSLKPSTIDSYKSKLEWFWSSLFNEPVRSLRLVDLKRVDRSVEWSSQKTRKEAHAVLRGVFKWAMAEELCDANPAALLRAGAWQRPEIDAFSDAERLAILSELDGTAKAFYGLMFETGARTGELIGLEWSDVEPDAINIRRSVYRGKAGSTKTHQERRVLLTADAQALLAAHTSSRFARGRVFLNQYGVAFHNDRGLTFAFRLACGRAGVRYRRPYYCRHTFASRALSAGCEPTWVAAQMGDRLETVLRHYGRWIAQDRDRQQMAVFEKCGESVVGNSVNAQKP